MGREDIKSDMMLISGRPLKEVLQIIRFFENSGHDMNQIVDYNNGYAKGYQDADVTKTEKEPDNMYLGSMKFADGSMKPYCISSSRKDCNSYMNENKNIYDHDICSYVVQELPLVPSKK